MRIFPSNLYQTEEKVERVNVIVPTFYYFHAGTRTFFEQVLEEVAELHQQTAFRFLMVVDELVTNAIEYGSNVGDEVSISLYYSKSAWIEVVVEDGGLGKERKTAKEMTAFLSEKKKQEQEGILALRGRGLAKIVASWTDELEFLDRESGGLLVRARKYIV